MELHGSAALSPRQRQRLVLFVGSGMTIAAVAAIVGCSRQTGSKWVNRHRRGEGVRRSLLATAPLASPCVGVGRAGGAACACRAAGWTARNRLDDGSRGLDRACDPAPARLLQAQAASVAWRDRPLSAGAT